MIIPYTREAHFGINVICLYGNYTWNSFRTAIFGYNSMLDIDLAAPDFIRPNVGARPQARGSGRDRMGRRGRAGLGSGLNWIPLLKVGTN